MHRDLDLNLLAVFEAIYAERGLTRAGQRLHLTQSAVSHALSRLRAHFCDKLFVRRGNRMEPTPMAQRLADNLLPGLKLVQNALNDRGEFSPASSHRTFVLAMTDYTSVVLLPPLLAHLNRHAPGIRLRIMQTNFEERTQLMREGAIDLVLGCEHPYGHDISSSVLFSDREVCVVRKGHPLTQQEMTLERFLEAESIALSLSQTGEGFVEEYLVQKGLRRNVMLTVQQELTIPVLVSTTDFVGTMAERIAREFVRRLPIRLLPVPLPRPEFDILQHWHASRKDDPAHAWLRGIMSDVASSLPQVPLPSCDRCSTADAAAARKTGPKTQ